MKILLLSAYAASSHVHWQRSLQRMFPGHVWQVLSLPPRYFSWRVRGNPLYWAVTERELLEQGYDLLIATSMVDLATLRGLVPALGLVPAIVYFHENQFEYPQQSQQHGLLEAQMVSIYSALAANRIVFNSRYNMESFLSGCKALMSKLPDKVPDGLPVLLEQKAAVIAVPYDSPGSSVIKPAWPGSRASVPQGPLRLCWLGRFEHDKGGEGLLHILRLLETKEIDYELTVTGQQFSQSPAVFEQIKAEFSHRLVQFGYVNSHADYLALLGGGDIVLSTARHEFQGLAVMEGVACGCLPVVPDRLAYPEFYEARYRYDSCPHDPETEAAFAVDLIMGLATDLIRGRVAPPDMLDFCSQGLSHQYRQLLDGVASERDSH